MHLKIFAVLCFLSVLIFAANAETSDNCSQPHPKGFGPCRMLSYGFWLNPDTKACEQWMEGGCEVQGGHSYETLEKCKNECEVTA
ncbi:protease inhibitor-like [Teleopsis dalmanni]|uniref:protease inhibitor-like n=1 Tax=Teleopsis dalmanni TaxID=139649 RepID=UPI0018CE5E40|nr:protease inhibitor-like [Teleopsis dalmanni]